MSENERLNKLAESYYAVAEHMEKQIFAIETAKAFVLMMANQLSNEAIAAVEKERTP